MSDLEGLAHRFVEALGWDDSAEIMTDGAVSWITNADAGSDRVRACGGVDGRVPSLERSGLDRCRLHYYLG